MPHNPKSSLSPKNLGSGDPDLAKERVFDAEGRYVGKLGSQLVVDTERLRRLRRLRRKRFIRASSLSDHTTDVERIFIPTCVRGRAISEFAVSVRLGHLLEDAQVLLVGDLHGRSYVELGKYRNCGRKTLDELREMVARLQGSAIQATEGALPVKVTNPYLFVVPTEIRELKLAELPLSVRLRNVMGACGCSILGDLDNRDEREMLKTKNCGKTTIREIRELLRRAVNGEFSPETDGTIASLLHKIGRAIDAWLTTASTRDRHIFEQRHEENNGYPRTLEDIGSEFKMTRERVRQIVKKLMALLRTSGGPRLARAMEMVAKECNQRVCPLTPELWDHWLGETATDLEHASTFYIRVLDTMAPEIPAWPPGSTREGANDPEVETINAAVAPWLQQNGVPHLMADVLAWLRTQPGFDGVHPGTFLAALRRNQKIVVNFPELDHPMIRLRRLRIADFALAILTESAESLVPEDIIERAKVRFGSDAIVVTGRSAQNALTPEQGFYLLGPRAIGLRRHFHAPESAWPLIRDGFEKLLHAHNRPISTIEAIDAGWTLVPQNVNSYELAQILREDARFADLGRRLFGLAEWGVQEREHIKDLLPRVFVEAGHALTIDQTLNRLNRLRSVSPTGLSSIIRQHSELCSFGFGYYGLKSWGGVETEVILRDRRAVERAVRGSEFPTSFSTLCGRLRVDPSGLRAALLWKTCASSKKLRRVPDRQTPETLLLHKVISLEIALSAVMHTLGRPAPAYELQWELAEKYGEIFANMELSQITERLDRSSRFLRNAVGDFLLDVDFELEDFDVSALRAAAIKILTESCDIVGCDELIERLELSGFDIEGMSIDMLAAILRGSDGLQEVGSKRFRAKQ